MLIGNHSAPLSAVLFAQGATDTNWRRDGWMDRAGAVERGRRRGGLEYERSTLGVFTVEKEYEKSMRT